MRKLILLPAFLFFANIMVKSQAYSGQSDFKKSMQSAAINEFPYEEGTTEQAITTKFKALGYSAKSEDDYQVFRGVKLTDLGPDTYDLYFKTDKKSKKDKDKSVVSLLISKGNESFITEAGDTGLFINAKNFLNNLIADVAAADLQNQVNAQEEVVKKVTKKLSNLADDGNDLLKKQKKLEQEIEENKNAQATQQKELDDQTKILETLKAKQNNK